MMRPNYTIRFAAHLGCLALVFTAGYLGAGAIFDGKVEWWDIPLALFAVGVWTWQAYVTYPGRPTKTPHKN